MVNKLVLASLLMAFVACAMGGQKAAAPAPTATGATPSEAAPMPGDSDKQQQLEQAWTDLESARAQLEIEPAAACDGPGCPEPKAQPMATVLSVETDPTCKPSKSETCTGSCKLSKLICENAGKICQIAGELQPDRKSAQKCEQANATCTSAHKKCCGCL